MKEYILYGAVKSEKAENGIKVLGVMLGYCDKDRCVYVALFAGNVASAFYV